MRFVFRDGCFRNPQTGEPMDLPEGNEVCSPMIQSDIQAYRSPLGDHWVDGRRAQREELKRNNMVINEKRKPFDKEEYNERKSRQAKYTEKRRAGLA